MLAEYDAILARVREEIAALTTLLDAHAGFQRADPEDAGFVGDLEEALEHVGRGALPRRLDQRRGGGAVVPGTRFGAPALERALGPFRQLSGEPICADDDS